MIRKHYVDTVLPGGIIQTHYRQAGRGKPLLMLHPSPLSSAFMVPLIELMQSQTAVYAPDTPGYGATDALPEPGEDLEPYVVWVDALLDSLGLEKVLLYGSATGAQIAIEYAKHRPERVDHLLLENAVHFDDEERAGIMQHYFPSIAPKPDGSHLRTVWEMADGLFRQFPWYAGSSDSEASTTQPPVAAVHATAMGYLTAGDDYARAYKAAFNNERAERLQAVNVPVSLMRWDGSILKSQADQLDDFEWPDSIRMVHCGSSIAERYAALESELGRILE